MKTQPISQTSFLCHGLTRTGVLFVQSAVFTVSLFAISIGLQAAEKSTELSANEVMKQAHRSRAVWEDFPGFESQIVIHATDGNFTGTVSADSDFEVTLKLDEKDAPGWILSKLRSVISHRRARPMRDSQFAFVEGHLSASGTHRIAEPKAHAEMLIHQGRIQEIVRKTDSRWLEIANVKQIETAEGQVLPEVTSITYRDPATGQITSNRTNYFSWVQVGEYQLPAHLVTVEVGNDGQRSTREISFSGHKLHNSNPQRAVLHKPLKESLTSFGAAVLEDYLYVFSGHNGDAHGFGRDALSDHFRRIKYDDPNAEWEELAKHDPAQSTALLSDGKYIYRIGGLTFLNRGDEETNFKSTTHFAKYDPSTNKWTDLKQLPEARSSLDAAILGREIYVCGGWNLQGSSSSDAPWHNSILKFNLDHPESGWEVLDGPGYVTRAASVAAHNGKIYLLGGIQQRGFTRKVSIYDPQTGEWSEGPEIKSDSRMAGFATSSFSTGGELYYTGSSGVLYRLNSAGDDWENADRLIFPRMFLRLLPLSNDRLIALGGTVSGLGRTASVESIQLSKKPSGEKIVRWSVPFHGRAKHSQVLALDGVQLYAMGGNASPSPHDFSEEAFVDEAFVFDLSRQNVKPLPKLPIAMQSGSSSIVSQTSEHRSMMIAGGLGFRDGEFGSLNKVLEFDLDGESWNVLPQELPASRSMFHSANFEDAIWYFGGAKAGAERELLSTVLHWWGDDSQISKLPEIEIPTPRRSFGGAILGEEYFMVGGLTAETGIAETVDVFHFKERTWRTITAPKTPRVFPSLVASSGKLYLYGGFTRIDGHFGPATSLEAYDPETDTWTTVTEQITDVGPEMTMLDMNGRLLFYGIDRQQDGIANFVLFDPDPMAVPETVEGMSFSRQRGAANEAKQYAKVLMRKDANKDAQLSREELGKRMNNFFDQADSNKDEVLSLTEIVTSLTEEEEQKENSSEDQ